jgi:hypothetical protein
VGRRNTREGAACDNLCCALRAHNGQRAPCGRAEYTFSSAGARPACAQCKLVSCVGRRNTREGAACDNLCCALRAHNGQRAPCGRAEYTFSSAGARLACAQCKLVSCVGRRNTREGAACDNLCCALRAHNGQRAPRTRRDYTFSSAGVQPAQPQRRGVSNETACKRSDNLCQVLCPSGTTRLVACGGVNPPRRYVTACLPSNHPPNVRHLSVASVTRPPLSATRPSAKRTSGGQRTSATCCLPLVCHQLSRVSHRHVSVAQCCLPLVCHLSMPLSSTTTVHRCTVICHRLSRNPPLSVTQSATVCQTSRIRRDIRGGGLAAASSLARAAPHPAAAQRCARAASAPAADAEATGWRHARASLRAQAQHKWWPAKLPAAVGGSSSRCYHAAPPRARLTRSRRGYTRSLHGRGSTRSSPAPAAARRGWPAGRLLLHGLGHNALLACTAAGFRAAARLCNMHRPTATNPGTAAGVSGMLNHGRALGWSVPPAATTVISYLPPPPTYTVMRRRHCSSYRGVGDAR